LPEAADVATPVGIGWRSGAAFAPAALDPNGLAHAPTGVSRKRTVGFVRGLAQRSAGPYVQVLAFRVERFDEQGDRLPPVTVEMRGLGFKGSLNEGDQVEIAKKPKPGKVTRVPRLFNRTAASAFAVQTPPLWQRILQVPVTLMAIAVTLIVLGVFGYIIYALISGLLR
jgi:hypothetical protein